MYCLLVTLEESDKNFIFEYPKPHKCNKGSITLLLQLKCGLDYYIVVSQSKTQQDETFWYVTMNYINPYCNWDDSSTSWDLITFLRGGKKLHTLKMKTIWSKLPIHYTCKGHPREQGTVNHWLQWNVRCKEILLPLSDNVIHESLNMFRVNSYSPCKPDIVGGGHSQEECKHMQSKINIP